MLPCTFDTELEETSSYSLAFFKTSVEPTVHIHMKYILSTDSQSELFKNQSFFLLMPL